MRKWGTLVEVIEWPSMKRTQTAHEILETLKEK